MTDPMRREGEDDGRDDEPLASSSTALSALSCEGWLVTVPADCLQGGLEIRKMVHVLPNEEKKPVLCA